jgi:hypothetical protein
MNKTNNAIPLGVLGSFAPSGFFAKRRVGASKPVQAAYRNPYEAATPAQTARLLGVISRGMASHLRF